MLSNQQLSPQLAPSAENKGQRDYAGLGALEGAFSLVVRLDGSFKASVAVQEHGVAPILLQALGVN